MGRLMQSSVSLLYKRNGAFGVILFPLESAGEQGQPGKTGSGESKVKGQSLLSF